MNKNVNLPNTVTALALLLSWISILLLINERFHLSLALAFLAFAADSLDGFLARKLKQETSLGRQLDSLVDSFVYLLYPALSYYIYFGLKDTFSILVIYSMLGAGIFRLGRFNLLGFSSQKNLSYLGLPVFSSYAVILIVVVLSEFLAGLMFKLVVWGLLILQSFLMVGNFSLPKPKTIVIVFPILLVVSIYFFYLALR